jgi:DNA-binding Xre family transcriptional regulator
MNGSTQLREAIKRQLKARDLRYVDLAKALRLSEASVKRLLSRGGITLERLDAICEFLGVDVYELVRSGRQEPAAQERQLALGQERALADDPMLLTVFHLLCNDWNVAQIRGEFGLSEPETVLLLARLDRLRLIELLPGNRTRLRVPRDFAWRHDGPVLKRHARSAMIEFLRGDFAKDEAVLRLEIKELGTASLALLRRRLERLVAEFNELAELDAALPGDRRRGVGLVLAMRPWTFSLMQTLKAERQTALGESGAASATGARNATIMQRADAPPKRQAGRNPRR